MKNEDAGRTGRQASSGGRERPQRRRARRRQAAGQEAGGDGWAAARRPRHGRQRMQPSSIYPCGINPMCQPAASLCLNCGSPWRVMTCGCLHWLLVVSIQRGSDPAPAIRRLLLLCLTLGTEGSHSPCPSTVTAACLLQHSTVSSLAARTEPHASPAPAQHLCASAPACLFPSYCLRGSTQPRRLWCHGVKRRRTRASSAPLPSPSCSLPSASLTLRAQRGHSAGTRDTTAECRCVLCVVCVCAADH